MRNQLLRFTQTFDLTQLSRDRFNITDNFYKYAVHTSVRGGLAAIIKHIIGYGVFKKHEVSIRYTFGTDKNDAYMFYGDVLSKKPLSVEIAFIVTVEDVNISYAPMTTHHAGTVLSPISVRELVDAGAIERSVPSSVFNYKVAYPIDTIVAQDHPVLENAKKKAFNDIACILADTMVEYGEYETHYVLMFSENWYYDRNQMSLVYKLDYSCHVYNYSESVDGMISNYLHDNQACREGTCEQN